jgi:hypothetical protein
MAMADSIVYATARALDGLVWMRDSVWVQWELEADAFLGIAPFRLTVDRDWDCVRPWAPSPPPLG